MARAAPSACARGALPARSTSQADIALWLGALHDSCQALRRCVSPGPRTARTVALVAPPFPHPLPSPYRIVRAFLIEEQKIVKKVLKTQAAATK